MDVITLPTQILLFLFIVAIVAGLIDTLAGGGGMLTIPALIMSGVPPLPALGTNKLQAFMGTGTATLMMFRKGKLRWPDVKILMLSAFVGSALGTVILQFINAEVLSFVIPVVLLLIGIYFLFSSFDSNQETTPSLSVKKYQTFIVPIVGCYDGMFGPGTGSFFTLAGVKFRGHDLISATAVAKSLNFSTNVASLIVFIMAGQLVWKVGASMMLGQVIGAWLGSHCLFRVNPKYLRIIVVIMSFGMLLRYVLA